MFKKILTHLSFIPIALADGSAIDGALPNPLKTGSSIPCLLNSLAKWLVYFTAFVVPIFIIIGAFQMLTSAGNAEKFNTGKKTIVYAIIGFVIVILAKGITDVVKNALGASTGTLSC